MLAAAAVADSDYPYPAGLVPGPEVARHRADHFELLPRPAARYPAELALVARRPVGHSAELSPAAAAAAADSAEVARNHRAELLLAARQLAEPDLDTFVGSAGLAVAPGVPAHAHDLGSLSSGYGDLPLAHCLRNEPAYPADQASSARGFLEH